MTKQTRRQIEALLGEASDVLVALQPGRELLQHELWARRHLLDVLRDRIEQARSLLSAATPTPARAAAVL